ncbi:EI24 domain-containing protein [Thermocoleostomius sinensis]|uniref:EI24 domain-containing protein n=1 Tax=Thermocoleostomius sinensis A174 TaxID=2016057 RepID=A0A9E8ZD93_9CYAN|nr:EI24 domain-containing protein [Thermocoleostomius sinensis]WAL60787.1 EI24 domain-containing protein [Thermocoleostomius sinensis A174]
MSQPSVPQRSLTLFERGPGGLIVGALYPLQALWLLLKTPRLRRYILIPILINLILGMTVYAGLLIVGLNAIDRFLAVLPIWIAEISQDLSNTATRLPSIDLPTIPTDALPLPSWFIPSNWHINLPTWVPSLPNLPHWPFQWPHWAISLPNWLTTWNVHLPLWLKALPDWGVAAFIWLLRGLLTLVLLFVTGFIFLQFGVLLGAPWYGKLSEEIEMLRTGQMVLIEVNPAVEIGRAVFYELRKLGLTIGIGLPILLLGLFLGPGTGVATIGGITLASMITCLDFLDAAVERRRPSFRQKLGVVFRSLPASASFGLVCLGLVSIPLVNLLAIPVCVAAGTLFFCDRVLAWFQPSETINS